ncbi:MAG: Glucose-phosphate thymidylyltransferase [Clostridia bacterium]|nr:Glucose-phosphate thymidylyltransferase [Clostridia bacterium]
MKGVVLAGGKGTRLSPLTYACNKHLLLVGKEPMIYNPIRQLVSADIKEILITSSREHIDEIREAVGSGEKFNCRITYKIQEEVKGIADALLLAEAFAGGDLIAVVLGDNITTHSMKNYVDEFKKQGVGAKVLLKEVADPERYGVAVLKEDVITAIVEKPSKFISSLAVTGIYFYDGSVFDIIRTIAPSKNGELGITPVNNAYLQQGQLTYDILEGKWTDAGTLDSLQFAEELLITIGNQIIKNK